MKKAGQTSSRDSHKPKEPSWYKHKRGDEEATINSPSSRNQKPNAVKLKHANSTAKTTSKADGGLLPTQVNAIHHSNKRDSSPKKSKAAEDVAAAG